MLSCRTVVNKEKIFNKKNKIVLKLLLPWHSNIPNRFGVTEVTEGFNFKANIEKKILRKN